MDAHAVLPPPHEGGLPADAYSASCFIDPPTYDHSCTTDSDCIYEIPLDNVDLDSGQQVRPFGMFVFSGNYCESRCDCEGFPVEFIGKKALAQFVADVSKTPLGSGAVPLIPCGCPASPIPAPPICQNGLCPGASASQRSAQGD